MKSKSRPLRLGLIICLILGWATYLPGASPPIALADDSDPPRNAISAPREISAFPTAPRVGINGVPCAYESIQDAVDAASPGDVIQAAAEVFPEMVIVTKTLTIVGGYDTDCTTYLTGTTTVNSGGAGAVFEISNAVVTLRNLAITGGVTGNGGGVRALSDTQVTLDNTDVFGNQANNGGGVYISPSGVVTLTNDSDITGNTATDNGGGVRVWGRLVGNETQSDIAGNSAPNGGGVSVPGGTLILYGSDMMDNHATAVNGKGGGIHVYDGGVVTTTNNVWIYNGHTAYDGAGIYADNATLYMNSASIREGLAANNGGGVYLANGSILYASAVNIGYPASGTGNAALLGAGLYVDASTVNFSGQIINNVAATSGGGVYANNGTINLTNAYVGGTEANQANQLGPNGHMGAGLYLSATLALLNNTVVASNTFQTVNYAYGGGLYLSNSSSVTLTNSRVERHLAPSTTDGRGAGIYLQNSTATLDNSAVLSNTAGTTAGGIRIYNNSVLNVLNSSELRNNHALNGEGGAVAGASMTGAPDINISDSTLRENTAGTHGGAIYMSSGTLDFTGGWVLRQNTAGGNGGAVAVLGDAVANFHAGGYSLVYNNQATSGHGGMVYLGNNTTTQLRATSGAQMYIYANTASANGGALYADSGGFFDIYGQIAFDRNRADNGGAVYLRNGSRVWLDDYDEIRPQLWDNRADNGSGGAIYAQDSPSVECDGATFGQTGDGNQASEHGGALYLSGSIFDADNCIFQDNQAGEDGGAIAAYTSTLDIYASYPAPSLTTQPSGVERELHSTAAPASTPCNPQTEQCSALFSNVADSDANNIGDGGAIYTNDSRLLINHTYLHRNSAYHGGAIYQSGANAAAQIANSLVYSNTVSHPLGAGIRRSGGAFTVTHTTLAHNIGGSGFSGLASAVTNTIAWGNTTGGFTITPTITLCNIDNAGYAGVNVDPQFVAPGVGEDYRLQGTSPAIDACATGLPLDLDNKARPIGDQYDMGAYEGQGESHIFLPLVLRSY